MRFENRQHRSVWGTVKRRFWEDYERRLHLSASLAQSEAEIGKLDAEIARRARENDVARRLMTVPGIGPLIATAIATLPPSC